MRDQYNIEGNLNIFGTRVIEIKGTQQSFKLDFYLSRLYPREVNPNSRFTFIHRDVNIEKLTKSNRYLAICGNPGYGKTYELQHLFNSLRNNPENLVHYEKLSDYKTYRFDVKIETKHHFDKYYLLLDGIDESNMAYVHADIDKFIRNNPEWSIIITSRTTVFDEERFRPFKKFEMEGLSNSDIKLFIDRSIPNFQESQEFKNKLQRLDLWSKCHIPFYINLFLDQKDYILSDEIEGKNLLDQIFEKTIERRLQPSLLKVPHELIPKIKEQIKIISFVNVSRNEYKITMSDLKSILGEDEDLTEFVVTSSAIISNISDELQLFDQKIQEYLSTMVLQKFNIKDVKKIVLTQGVEKTLKYQWIAPLKHLLSRNSNKGLLKLLLRFMPHAYISATDLELNRKELKDVIDYLKFEFTYYPNKMYHHTFFELKNLKEFLEKYKKYDFLIELLKTADQDTMSITSKVLSFFHDFNTSQKNRIDDRCKQLLSKTDIQIATRSSVLELHSKVIDYSNYLKSLYAKNFNENIQVPYVLQIISQCKQEDQFIDDILDQFKKELHSHVFSDNNISFGFVSFFQNITRSITVIKVLNYFISENLSSNHQDFFSTWFKRLKEHGSIDYLDTVAYELLRGNYQMISNELTHLVELIVSENLDQFVEKHKESSDYEKNNFRVCLAQILNLSNLKELLELYRSNDIEQELNLTYKDEIRFKHPSEEGLLKSLIQEGVVEEIKLQAVQERIYYDELWKLVDSYDSFRVEFAKEFSNPVVRYDKRLRECYSKWNGIDCHIIQFAFPSGRKPEFTQIEIEEYHSKHWACCLQFKALENVYKFLSPEKIAQTKDIIKGIIENTIDKRSKKATNKFYRSSRVDYSLYKFIIQDDIILLRFEQAKHFLVCLSLYNSNQFISPLEYIEKIGTNDEIIKKHLTHLLTFDNIEENVVLELFEYFIHKGWSTEMFFRYMLVYPKLLKNIVNEYKSDNTYIKTMLLKSQTEIQIDILSNLLDSSLIHYSEIIISNFENQLDKDLKLRAAILAIKIQHLPGLKHYLVAVKQVQNYRYETLKPWVDKSGFSVLLAKYLDINIQPINTDHTLIRIKEDLYDCILRVVGANYEEYLKFVTIIKFNLIKYEGVRVITNIGNIRKYLGCKTKQGFTLIRLLDDIRFRYSISEEQLTLEEALGFL